MLSVAALNTAALTVYPRIPINTPTTARTMAASTAHPGIITTSITTALTSTYRHRGYRHMEATAGEHHGRGCRTTSLPSKGMDSQRHILQATHRILTHRRGTHPITIPTRPTAASSDHSLRTRTRRPRWAMLLDIFRTMHMTDGTTRDTTRRQRDSWAPGSSPTRTYEGL